MVKSAVLGILLAVATIALVSKAIGAAEQIERQAAELENLRNMAERYAPCMAGAYDARGVLVDGVVRETLMCGLGYGHSGDHKAKDSKGQVLVTWPRLTN